MDKSDCSSHGAPISYLWLFMVPAHFDTLPNIISRRYILVCPPNSVSDLVGYPIATCFD
jgi:hypothetical protein